MRHFLAPLGAIALALALLAPATAQISTPEPTLGRTLPAQLDNAAGTTIGVAVLAETDDRIGVHVLAVG